MLNRYCNSDFCLSGLRSSPTARKSAPCAAPRIRWTTCSACPTRTPRCCWATSATTFCTCSPRRRGSPAASSTTGVWHGATCSTSGARCIRSCRASCSCPGTRTASPRASTRPSRCSSARACSSRSARTMAASCRATPGKATRCSACVRWGIRCSRRSSATTSRSRCWPRTAPARATLEVFSRGGRLEQVGDDDGGILARNAGQSDEVFRVRALGHPLQQAFERYYIAISVLAKNGSGTLGAGELESLCQLAAQRLSLLYAPAAPEFFDKALFRGFIQKLRELELVWLDGNSKLVFDQRLDAWARDAKVILGRELRHTIEKVSPEAVRPKVAAEEAATEPPAA